MPSARSIQELTQQNVEAIALMEKASNERRTFGEHVADMVAHTVGSWRFIIVQSTILTVWMTLNVIGWVYEWDPFPFILLNLVLSFQAAYASPIIMMSQNRQAKINERRDELDLQINLLSEQENTETLRMLRLICDKLDIDITKTAEQIFEQETHPKEVIQQIEQTAEKTNGKKPMMS